jgi:hypothetical protein
MKITDFAGKTPTLLLEEFFNGRLNGWGVTLTRFESLQNQFRIEAEGMWDAAARTLAVREVYTFDDCHTDVLTWAILKRDDGSYEGRETNIVGVAEGHQAGNAFLWEYTREVPAADGSKSKFGFTDWFWLQDERTRSCPSTWCR